MKRRFILLILGILALTLVSAVFYPEPWGNDVDAGNNNLNNVNNVSANNFIGNLSGNMDWDNLQNYPVACPGSSAVTQLGDSVTCSDLWVDVAGDVMTGNLNMSGGNFSNISYLNPGGEELYLGTNLTLKDKITFRLGEIIDNIVDGWITITGSLNVTGNVTAENVHLPVHVSTHTNISITAVKDVWMNVTFDSHDDAENRRITHTYNDATNDTFTIVDTGVYRISYGISFLDSAPSPDNIVAIRLINNNVEIEGSVFEKDTTKQNAVATIYRNTLSSLTVGDEIIMQFVTNSTTISLQTAGTFGDHPTSANMNIHRIS